MVCWLIRYIRVPYINRVVLAVIIIYMLKPNRHDFNHDVLAQDVRQNMVSYINRVVLAVIIIYMLKPNRHDLDHNDSCVYRSEYYPFVAHVFISMLFFKRW
jgi:hypothetical protein